MTAIRHAVSFILLLIVSASLQATENRLMAPFLVKEPQPGAYGSLWTTVLIALNSGSSEAQIFDHTYPCRTFCPEYPTVAAGTMTPIQPVAEGIGIWLYPEEPGSMSMALRAQDLSRQAETWGTSIPLVRPEQFVSKVTLLDVPSGDEFRSALRIYSSTFSSSVPVTIRLSSSGGAIVAEGSASLERIDDAPVLQILDLQLTFPAISTGERYRIEVESLSPEDPVWALVTVTNNVTQHVTIIEPSQ